MGIIHSGGPARKKYSQSLVQTVVRDSSVSVATRYGLDGKGKDEVLPRTGHEGPEGE